MSKTADQQSKGFLKTLVSGKGGAARAEKARLEAFLDAVPGEYCGWGADGSAAYSEGFCKFLGIKGVDNIHDIQNALSPSDAAALEGMHVRLTENGESFSMKVRTANKNRTLKLFGARGYDTEQESHFDILWLENITDEESASEKQAQKTETAQAERDKLQAALDHMPQPTWLRDHYGEMTWCNKAYASALGTSMATVIADQKELSLKGKKPAGKLLAQEAVKNKEAASARGHVIMGGQRRLIEVTEVPVMNGDNGTIGTLRDVSREEELESTHNRYMSANKELLEQLGTAIGIFDSTQKLEFYNSAFGQLWHLEETYLNTRPKLGDIMEKLRETRRLPEQADFKKFKKAWLDMFTGLIQPHDEMLYLPDGSALRMLVMAHPLGGLMMTFEDVTSSLELESSYNTLIAVQKETLDNLAEGVSVYGGDGRLKLWNPSFARLWRFNPEDLEGEPHVNRLTEKIKSRFGDDKQDRAREVIMMQSLDRNIHEGQMECKDGTLIAYSTVPLPDGGVLVTHVDITDKMQVENALREKNAALEAAERVKLDFLANVSYQLRTPLNAIMGFAEILENEYFGKINDKQREYTKGMHEAGERLLSLINNILDLSTIEAGYMEIQHDKVSISDILNDIFELTAEWARKERIKVDMDCPKNVGSIEADERRLKQVLLNLMRNAITFTPENGKIVLKAGRSKDHVTISISDTGPGIPTEDQERIFEPFEKTHTGQQTRGGAGLGLALVKNIVALHGGTLKLESAEGKGTVFTITLPLTLPQAAPAPVKASA